MSILTQSSASNSLDKKLILKRYNFIEENPMFKERIIKYYEKKVNR